VYDLDSPHTPNVPQFWVPHPTPPNSIASYTSSDPSNFPSSYPSCYTLGYTPSIPSEDTESLEERDMSDQASHGTGEEESHIAL